MYAPKQAYDKHIFPPDGGLGERGERGGIGAPEGKLPCGGGGRNFC